MARMSRETKFGYGFLLVGAGVPYLIDKSFGLSWAIVLSVACVISGGTFLVAGHRHKDDVTGVRRSVWEWIALGAALSTLLALGSIGAVRLSRRGTNTEKPSPEATRQVQPETPGTTDRVGARTQHDGTVDVATAGVERQRQDSRPAETKPENRKPQRAVNKAKQKAQIEQHSQAENSPNVGTITQGPGSIAQIGGSGNQATVNNIDTRPHIAISDQQQSEITKVMRTFAGRKAFILANAGTRELVDFGTRMQAALQAAGIQAEFHTGMAMSEGGQPNPWLFIGWGQNNVDMGKALVGVVRDAGIVPINHVGVHFYQDGDKDGFQIIVFQPD